MNVKIDPVWKLLEEGQIPALFPVAASSSETAVRAAEQLGYPVAMKISSPDISHKSDVGGVVLNLGSDIEVEKAYDTIMDSVNRKVPEARVEGVTLQKMAEPGLEVIVGAKLDPQFGHVIMFGLGGIFVEVYKDVSFRVTPIDRQTARDMILEIRGSPIILGARGGRAADIEAIIDIITQLSGILEHNPDIVELDINPLIVFPEGALAVDARMLSN